MTVRFAGLCLRAGGACLTLVLCWPPILARAEAPSVLIPFAIPAQPLSQALVAYSRASGMTVLVDSGLTEGRQAPALDGRYTAGDALRRLLAGSPLSIRYASEYSFTLVADPRPARPRQPRLRDTAHAARLQAALRRVLCAAAGTAPGGYRALVQLWFDGDARVSKMNWITCSGLAARDQALEHALADMRAGPLPVDLPQPVTVLLEPRAARQCDMLEGASGG